MKRKKTRIVQHVYHNCTFSNISNVHGSTVLQGNRGVNAATNGSTIGGEVLSEQEREMLRLFRMFTIRQQTCEMSRWYEFADNLKGVGEDGEKE